MQAHIASCAAGDALLSQCVSNALDAHGAVAISHIDGLASARELALRSVSRCVVGTERHSAVPEKIYPDASTRRSLGARTMSGFPEPLAAQGVPGCEQLADTFELRAIIQYLVLAWSQVKSLVCSRYAQHIDMNIYAEYNK